MTSTKDAVVGVISIILGYAGIHILNRGGSEPQAPSEGPPRLPRQTEPFNPFEPVLGGFIPGAFIAAIYECGYSAAPGRVADAIANDVVAFETSMIPCLESKGYVFSYIDRRGDGIMRYTVSKF